MVDACNTHLRGNSIRPPEVRGCSRRLLEGDSEDVMSDPRAGGKLVARDTRPPFVTEHTTSPHCDLPQGPDLSGCLTPMTCLTSLRHQSEVTRAGGVEEEGARERKMTGGIVERVRQWRTEALK